MLQAQPVTVNAVQFTGRRFSYERGRAGTVLDCSAILKSTSNIFQFCFLIQDSSSTFVENNADGVIECFVKNGDRVGISYNTE
jgi:hypothetical protein